MDTSSVTLRVPPSPTGEGLERTAPAVCKVHAPPDLDTQCTMIDAAVRAASKRVVVGADPYRFDVGFYIARRI